MMNIAEEITDRPILGGVVEAQNPHVMVDGVAEVPTMIVVAVEAPALIRDVEVDEVKFSLGGQS